MSKLICNFCSGDNFEKMSEEEYICKTCGYGWNGKPADIKKTLRRIGNLAKYLMVQNPNATQGQIVEMVITKLHHIERHPIRQDGFCEYCQRVF